MVVKRWNILARLIKLYGFREGRGAEVGVKAGRNIMEVLKVHPKFHWIAVDPWAPTENYARWPDEAFKINEDKFDRMHKNWPDNIQKMKMLSHDAAESVEDESLDVVFIDGDHSYEGVSLDIKCWLPKVKVGGIIAGHDYDNTNKYGEAFRGVDRAVHETFGDRFNIDQDHVWWTTKT